MAGFTDELTSAMPSLSPELAALLLLIVVILLAVILRATFHRRLRAHLAQRAALRTLFGEEGFARTKGRPLTGHQKAIIRERFEAALDGIGAAGWQRPNGADPFEQPWYTIIGRRAGAGGEPAWDWWFVGEAELARAALDRPEDSLTPSERARWHSFLDKVRAHRPRYALNGVIMLVPGGDLATWNGDERATHAEAMRQRLQELLRLFARDVPAYLLLAATSRDHLGDDAEAGRFPLPWGAAFMAADRSVPTGADFDVAMAGLIKLWHEPRIDKAASETCALTPAPEPFPQPQSGQWRPVHASATRIGTTRTENQDSLATLEEAGIYAVADGIGGLKRGRMASRSVVNALERTVQPGAALELRADQARNALNAINGTLFAMGITQQPPQPMGSTVAMVAIGEGRGICLWAGDSRVYLLRAGALRQLTQDHTTIQTVPGTGAPRSVLTRAIGPNSSVAIDSCVVDLKEGDALLLCTDGVYGSVPDETLARLLQSPGQNPANLIVLEALRRGTRDDASAITLRLEIPAMHASRIDVRQSSA